MSSSSASEEEQVETLFVAEEQSSGEDPPMSEWSSLIIELPEDNKKKLLESKGLYSPGSGEVCAKYVAISDSQMFLHPYYNYPAVHDPGIKKALLAPERPIIHKDDGRDLYMALCLEMNVCPVRMFHRNLLSDEINLSFYGVQPHGVRAMAIALQYNKYVRIFNLTDNFLNDDACYHLGQMLNANVTLQELNLSGCRIGPSGLRRLGNTLHINKTLLSLDLSKNNIGEEGGVQFAKQVYDGATVKQINLSKNNLGRQTALAMAETLVYKNKMTHLDLSLNNFFHAPSMVKMLDELAYSEVLKELNLSWNALEGERIAESIRRIFLIPTLTKLDLSNNRFKGDAIALMLTNLIKAKKLVTLDLSYNPLEPNDALVALEKMLRPRVKVDNLLMTGVWVNKKFLLVLDKVSKMKSRKNFHVTYDGVLENWTIKGADARELILQRADYLGNLNKRNKVDVALFFMALNKENPKPIPVKDLIDRVSADRVPLDDDLIAELAVLFPGPKSAKTKSINLQTLCEYMTRLWPARKLPPTPVPEPEPEPELAPEPPPSDGKKKGKKDLTFT